MSYANIEDMLDAYGKSEVISLTDRDNLGEINTSLLERKLLAASGEIDSYLVGRYATPIFPVPQSITISCCDIVRYRLSGSGVTELETVRNRYKDALRFLESIRDGKSVLENVPPAVANTTPQNLAVFTARHNRVFFRDV